jgi:hypothetical protein
MSKETLGIVLGIGSFVLFIALYLVDKSGKQLPTFVWVGLLGILTVLSVTGVLLIPWFWAPSSPALKLWRVGVGAMVTVFLVARFGVWLLDNPPSIVFPGKETHPEVSMDDKKRSPESETPQSTNSESKNKHPKASQREKPKSPPVAVNQGPGSIAQIGGSGNQATVNNFSPPSRHLSGEQTVVLPSNLDSQGLVV